MPVEFSAKVVRIARTFNLFLSFFGLGLCVAVLGPTLLDLERTVNTDTEHITYVYTARSSGYLLGSIVGGFLFDHINRQFLLCCCTLLTAISILLVPWWKHLIALAVCVFISGNVTGALDTGGNVLCLDMWGQESGPYMQALHFMFGFGAFVAPLIAEPFLSPMPSNQTDSNISVIESSISSLPNNSLPLNATRTFQIPEDGYYIINAYAIIGGFMILVTLLFTVVFILHPQDVQPHRNPKHGDSAQHGKVFYVLIIILALFLFMLYAGLEVAFGQLIAIFVVKSNLRLSKSTGSFVTSVFWGAFMCTRAISIFWATRFSPFCMIFCDLNLIVVTSIALAFFADKSVELLWAGSALLGVGTASVFPCLFAWFEQFMQVSNRIASLFIIAASVGEMFLPMLVGHFVDRWPMILMYCTLFCAVSCLGIFLLIWLLTSRMQHYQQTTSAVSNKEHDETEH